MRLRLPELLDAAGMTAYALHKRSAGAFSLSLAYRIAKDGGHFRCLTSDQLDALCDVFNVPVAELFAPYTPKPPKRAKRTIASKAAKPAKPKPKPRHR